MNESWNEGGRRWMGEQLKFGLGAVVLAHVARRELPIIKI